MNEYWQSTPFSIHPASGMQVLLGHAAAIPPLLEAMEDEQSDPRISRAGIQDVLSRLQEWEDSFMTDGTLYRSISPAEMDLPTISQRLPTLCFAFTDVSQANSLTHCWSFRIVCLLQLSRLDKILNGSGDVACSSENNRHEDIECLCISICQGLPYLLQREMRFYGSMSAGFPLHMVSESLQTFNSKNCDLNTWCAAIKEQMLSQKIALFEQMAETGPFP